MKQTFSLRSDKKDSFPFFNENCSIMLHVSNLCNLIIKVSFSESFSVVFEGAFYPSLLYVAFLHQCKHKIANPNKTGFYP